MAVIDVRNSLVKVSATSGGTAATISDIRTYEATHGSEGDTRVRVFGRSSPYVAMGGKDDSYRMSGLYNPADTGGQNVLRAAHDAGSTVFLQVLQDGAAGQSQECRVTEYSDSGDADGDFIACAFTLAAVGDIAAVSGP